MAITILYGPGGSGKSLLQVLIVIRQLRETKRNVVTNLALDLPRLNQYFQQTYPSESIDVIGRVRLITQDQAREFWRIRGPVRWVGPDANDYDEDKGRNGVCFIIDEAGSCGFDAAGWAASVGRTTRGTELIGYLEQQRKYGDDVFASANGRTPHTIAKGFRDRAHQFVRLRNERLAKYWIFRGRDRFVASYFMSEPSDRSEPFMSETWSLDAAGVASCYRTEVGMGVVGTGADKGARAKGISIWWAAVAAALLMVALGAGPYLLGKLASGFISGSASAATDAAKGSASAAFLVGGVPPSLGEGGKGRMGLDVHSRQPSRSHVTVLGYVAHRDSVLVRLSDGRTLIETDIDEINSRYVLTSDGQRYFMASPRSPVQGQQASGANSTDGTSSQPLPAPALGSLPSHLSHVR